MSSQSTADQEEGPTTGVLVLCNTPEVMKNAIAFLNRRGVQAFAVSNMNEAVECLTKKMANFVLLSANFPHPKIELLPSLFQQTFKTECIGFVEKSERKAETKLTSMGCRHIIYGQASGPAILMRIRQIEKEARAAADTGAADGSAAPRALAKEEGGEVVISGKTARDGNNIVLKGGKTTQETSEASSQAMKTLGDSEESLGDSGGTLHRSGETFVAKGKAPKRFSAMQEGNSTGRGFGVLKQDPRLQNSPYLDKGSRKKNKGLKRSSSDEDSNGSATETKKPVNDFSVDTWDRKEKPKEPSVNTEKDETKGSFKTNASEKDPESKGSALEAVGSNPKGDLLSAEAAAPQSQGSSAESSSSPPEVLQAQGAAPNSKGTAKTAQKNREAILHDKVQNQEPSKNQISKQQGFFGPKDARPESISSDPKKALFWDCARHALIEISESNGVNEEVLFPIHSLAMMSIRAPSVRGSFLLAIGHGRDFPFGALSSLGQKLVEQFRGYGHVVDDTDCEMVDMQGGSFAETLFSVGDFMLVARSSIIEIGIAFLDIEQKEPTIGPAFNDHTVIKVNEVSTGMPVTFEAYLHLPINQRVVRYLKVGSIFEQQQKDKLVASGTENFLLKPSEIRAYREYFARNSLQSVIDQRKQNLKKAV